jgi:hypothetical protein
VSATGGNAQATVTWQAPASGGSPLTGYVVVTLPGGVRRSVSAGSTSATLTGLTNGTAYTFQVLATNAVGEGPASAPSNPVTPATVPGAPTGVSATHGNAQATVAWQAPASNGGSPLTGYTVTALPGGAQVSVGAGSLSATVPGLTNGTAYTFTVFATNSVGRGPNSAPSNSVTPSAVPGAPTGVNATGGNAQATVTWQAPSSNGGSPITGYTVTASPGGAQVSVGAGSLSATVTGLTNGTAYTFVVAAQNAQGFGPASAPSNPVVPATVPAAPTQVVATATEGGASVSWSAPQNDGGAALTGYRLTSNPAAVQLTLGAGSTSAQVTGLTAGTAYTFTVQALNAVGASVPSSPSNAVTPLQRVQVSIGFDNLAAGAVVTTQYPQLTVSSDTGHTNTTRNLASIFNTSVPNILCTEDCKYDTYLDFTRPARDVKLKAVGVNNTGKAFAVRVHRQGQPVTHLEYSGQGQAFEPVLVDLSALGDITRVELVEIIDGFGVGWDDLSFSTLQ